MTGKQLHLTRLAMVGLVLGSWSPQIAHAQTVRAHYEAALGAEQTVRAQIDGSRTSAPEDERTALLAKARQVIASYESLVRRYHNSGYADNALFNAAGIADTLFGKFAETRDRDTALRLYKRLDAEYPASSLVKQIDPLIARLEATTASRARQSDSPPVAAADSAPTSSEASKAPASNASTARTAPSASNTSSTGNRSSARAKLTAIERTILPEAVRITIALDREVVFREESLTGPARVFFDLKGVEAVPELVDAVLRYPSDAVRQIRVGRHPDSTVRVVLDLEGVKRHTVYPLYDPFRLVIDAEPLTAAPVPVIPAPSLVPTRGPKTVVNDARAIESHANEARATEARASEPRPLIDATPRITPASLPSAVLARVPALPAPAPTPAPLPPVAATATAPTPTPAPAAPTANAVGGFSIARQLGLGVSRIVIDPGHGGHDPGAQVKGLNEADLTLDIALRLEKLLQDEPGLDVVLTRRDNVYIPLEERTAIANREGADLFLSIHANASRNLEARGVETYFLSFASSPDAENVAARENSASARDMHTLPDIIKAIALNNKLDESRDLAGMVQEALITRLRRSNKSVRSLGVKKAPFVVLIGAEMPSVLAEVSFLTNKQELQLLKTAAYKQRIAEALHAAVMRYRRSLKGRGAVAAQ